MTEAAFKLFRATGPARRGVSHIGSVKCPHCERHSFVEARVVEAPQIARHFEGDLHALQERVPGAAPRPVPKSKQQRALDLPAPIDPELNDALPESFS